MICAASATGTFGLVLEPGDRGDVGEHASFGGVGGEKLRGMAMPEKLLGASNPRPLRLPVPVGALSLILVLVLGAGIVVFPGMSRMSW